MTENADTQPIDYKAEYDKILAERDAFAKSLDEYISENNRLKAELTVQQAINRKTVGASAEPPKEKGLSLKDAIAKYKESFKE